MQQYQYQLFADYFQFYLQDEAVEGDLSNSWTQEASQRLLALAPGTIGVGTLRNVTVDVIVELAAVKPEIDLLAWDHVVECGLSVTSGKLAIAGCTDYFPDAARIDIQPGHYRVFVLGGGFDSVRNEWEEAEDLYKVMLWPDQGDEVVVLKQWQREEGP